MAQNNFINIDNVFNISSSDIYNEYIIKQKPLILKGASKLWPAYYKWSFEYINNVAGDQIVPLYNSDPVDYNKKVNEPIKYITMSKYIDILNSGPTDLRIFLYNLISKVPELKNDYITPDFKVRILKSIPMLFFGGELSSVFMHYDIDLANIFHFHFVGKKKIMIVSPKYNDLMYKVPYSVICREDINFDNIDYEKWPALKGVKFFVGELNHGDMLYIPEGWWHYMKYLTPGFSMSLRSLPIKISNIIKAINNIFIVRNFDNIMRKLKGKSWLIYKNFKALERTNKKNKIIR